MQTPNEVIVRYTKSDGKTESLKYDLNRWTKYGKDRLYVTSETRKRAGYLDLNTGRWHSEEASNMDLDKCIRDAVKEAVYAAGVME